MMRMNLSNTTLGQTHELSASKACTCDMCVFIAAVLVHSGVELLKRCALTRTQPVESTHRHEKLTCMITNFISLAWLVLQILVTGSCDADTHLKF